MSVASQQYSDITEELQKNFENHEFISIIATHASGSEEFQITYKVNGLVEDDTDEIKVEKNHTILLSIPFGFPLFAPNCKPITSTFHPDFDPGAICLGDFWNQDRTCTELVEFISKMIIGEVYSKENAFNEKAAQWYAENSDEFPLSDIDTSFPQPRSEIVEDPIDESFSTDFDYLSLEDSNILEEETFTDNTPDYDIEHLTEMANKKAFYQLDRELNTIPISADFPQRDTFRGQIDTAFSRAQKYQKEGADHEAEGVFDEAKIAYTKALATVSDFYGVRESLERVEQAILIGAKPKKKIEETVAQEEEGEEGEENAPPKKKRSAINIKQYVPLVAGGAGLIAIALLSFNTFESYSVVGNVEETYLQCEDSLAKKEFRTAKSMCESVINVPEGGGLFFSGKLQDLQSSAQKILTSEDLVQGIAGKVKVNGIWVDKSELQKTSPFQTLITKAEQSLQEEEWSEASEVIRQASALAKTEEDRDQINTIRTIFSFEKSKQKALFVYEKNGCAAAEPHLLKAKQEALKIKEPLQEEYLPEIESYITECTFYQLIAEGNKLYESSDWENALPIYQDALNKINAHAVDSKIPLSEIKQKVNKSELYSTMDKANKSFANSQWSTAIEQYQHAIDLIEKNSAGNARINTDKIKRIILQAQVIEAQQLGHKYYSASNYQGAISQQKVIANYISGSSFSEDANFAIIKDEVPREIARLEKEAFIEQKKNELRGKQMDLFLENYPAANPETLKNPDVLFVSDTNGLITYKMQATETAKGRPLTLVIFYAYNRNTGAWEFAQTPEKN